MTWRSIFPLNRPSIEKHRKINAFTKQPFALSAALSLSTQLLSSPNSYQIFYPSPCISLSVTADETSTRTPGFQLNAKEKEQKDATCWGMKRDHVKPVVPRDALQRRKERSMHFVMQPSRRRTGRVHSAR